MKSEKNGRIPERLELALDKRWFFFGGFTLEGSGSNWSYTFIEQQEIWTIKRQVCVCVRGVFGCIICMIFEVQDLSAYLYQYITLLFGMEEEIAGEHHSQPTPE